MSSAPPGGRAPTRPTIGTVLGVGARFPRRSCPHSIECGNAGQLITPKPNEPCFPMSSTEPGRTANTPGHAGRSVRGRTRSGIAARQGSRPRKPGSLGRTTRSSVFRRSGHTAEENRPTQEKFRCGSCGHSARADSVGALNALWAGPGRPGLARSPRLPPGEEFRIREVGETTQHVHDLVQDTMAIQTWGRAAIASRRTYLSLTEPCRVGRPPFGP